MSAVQKTIKAVPEPEAASVTTGVVSARSPWRRRMLMASVPLLLAAGGGYVWLTGGRYVGTDNAYVQQPLVTVSTEVAGRIVAVDVAANQDVQAGQPIFRIDPASYQIALDRAEGALAAARQQVDQLRWTHTTALAQLAAAEAMRDLRQRELARQQAMADHGILAADAVDAANFAARSAENEASLAAEGLKAAAAALGGDPTIATDDTPSVRTAAAQLAAARQEVEQLRAAYAMAQAKLTAANGLFTVRSRELGRQQSLTDRGISASAALDEATLAAQATENEVALAREGVRAAAAALGGSPTVATDDVPAVRTALARLEAARLAVGQLRTDYSTAQARRTAAEAIVEVRQRELERQQWLSDQGIAAATALDTARLAARSADDAVTLAQDTLAAALAGLGGDPEIATDAVPAVKVALAQRDEAARALNETSILAPASGRIAQIDALNLGQYVAPGLTVLSMTNTGETWVEANFKETQLATLRLGQPVEISVDAYPGLRLTGAVDSFSSATGSQLSLLPAQNATGNWVKVVQRLPVRISIVPDAEHPLRDGMSVHVSVDTGRSRLDSLL